MQRIIAKGFNYGIWSMSIVNAFLYYVSTSGSWLKAYSTDLVPRIYLSEEIGGFETEVLREEIKASTWDTLNLILPTIRSIQFLGGLGKNKLYKNEENRTLLYIFFRVGYEILPAKIREKNSVLIRSYIIFWCLQLSYTP